MLAASWQASLFCEVEIVYENKVALRWFAIDYHALVSVIISPSILNSIPKKYIFPFPNYFQKTLKASVKGWNSHCWKPIVTVQTQLFAKEHKTFVFKGHQVVSMPLGIRSFW